LFFNTEKLSRVVNGISGSLGLGYIDCGSDVELEKDPLNIQYDCNLLCGDNLMSLKKVSATLCEKVGLCYIDSPYNTGKQFIYDDSRKDDVHPVWGEHAAWMRFMLPRLVLMKDLLREDGVVALSIDDNALAPLKMMLNVVLGSNNFLGNIIVSRSSSGKASDLNVVSTHEYLLVFGKTDKVRLPGFLDLGEGYTRSDEYGHYKINGMLRQKGQGSLRSDRPKMYFPLYYNSDGRVYDSGGPGLTEVFPVDSNGVERRWAWGAKKVSSSLHLLKASPSGVVSIKTYHHPKKRVKVRTLWVDVNYYSSVGTNEIKSIYGDKIFDTPKPVRFLADIIESMSQPNDLMLDLFSGSGTFAEAAHKVNSSDNGNRKVLLLESVTSIPVDHVAIKMGYTRICELTEKRLSHIKEKSSFRYSFSVTDIQRKAGL
jgi:adenine-specific DNA-methyltransferase